MKKSELDQTFATKIIYSKELLIDRLTIYKFLNYIFWQADPSNFAQEIKVKENNFLITHSRVNNLNYVPRCMPTLHPHTPNTLLIYVIRNKKRSITKRAGVSCLMKCAGASHNTRLEKGKPKPPKMLYCYKE